MAIPLVVLVGWAADKFGGPPVMMAMIGILILGILVMIFSSNLWTYALAVALLAPAATFWPVLWATIGRAFGRKHYNVIRGTSYGLMMTVSAAVPWVAGIIFTRSQSYYPALLALIVVCVLGVLGIAITSWAQVNIDKRAAKS